MIPASNIDRLVVAMVEAAQKPTLAEAAMAYAEAGLHIFPTQPKTKTPLKGSRGHLDATCDLDKVREWWTKHPQANIACSPGRSGLLVIDIDGPNRQEDDGTIKLVADGRKTWRKLRAAANDSSEFFKTLSPGKGKGQHAWFIYPANRRIGAPKLVDAPGLQAFGVLGYVMLPPSVHPEGPSYTFDTSSYSVTEVPKWLLDRIPDTTTSQADNATDDQTREFLEEHSGQGLTPFWETAVEAEADLIRQAELRHPAMLSALARIIGWATHHSDFDLNAGLEIILDATREVFEGEDRNYRNEFRRALNWVVGHEIAEFEAAKQAEKEARFGEWPPLKPLGPQAAKAPLHVLPQSIRGVVDTVAAHTQTPPEHAVLAALSTISAATVGNAVIDLGWIEQGALWTISVADPSDRKSAVLKLITSNPLVSAMNVVKDGLTEKIREVEGRRKAALARLQAIEKGMTKESPTATAEDWAQAQAELEEIEQVDVPAFLITDATPESIEITMESQLGAASAVSAEGDLISSLAGRYSDNKARVGTLNSAWSGEPVYIRRVKGDRTITEPHLSMTLIVQPTVINKIGQTSLFIETGFAARFLYANPKSLVGHRASDSIPLDGEAITQWTTTVTEILSRFWGSDKITLTIDREGARIIKALRDRVEALLRTADLAEAERYWLGKAVGQIGRIALMLALADDPAAQTVTGSYVERAAGLFDFLFHEARNAFGQSLDLTNVDVDHARQISVWLQRRAKAGKLEEDGELTFFSWRDLSYVGPGKYRKADDQDRMAALELLSDCHYLRPLGEAPATSGGRGGRPKGPRWAVSPRVLSQEDESPNEPETGGFVANRASFELPSDAVVSPGQKVMSQTSQVTYIQKKEKGCVCGDLCTCEGDSIFLPTPGDHATNASKLPDQQKQGFQDQKQPAQNCDVRDKTPSEAVSVVHVGESTPPPASTHSEEDSAPDVACNPNLERRPVNAYVAKGFPKLAPDGSCSQCGSGEIHTLNGFVVCTDCRTSYTALVISGE